MELPTLDKFPKRVLAKIDIQRAFILSRLIIAAERLHLFRALHDKPMTAAAIGKSLKIHELYLLPFLNTMVALGLLRRKNNLYRNTPFAEKYFIAERSIYWTRQYSKECVSAYERLTVLEQALALGKRHHQIKGLAQPDYLERMKRNPHEAEDFTQMLFHLHQGDAEALAGYLDLAQHRKVLDVAGGSAVMSIALAEEEPALARVHSRHCTRLQNCSRERAPSKTVPPNPHASGRHTPRAARRLRRNHVLRHRSDSNGTPAAGLRKTASGWLGRSRGPLCFRRRH